MLVRFSPPALMVVNFIHYARAEADHKARANNIYLDRIYRINKIFFVQYGDILSIQLILSEKGKFMPSSFFFDQTGRPRSGATLI